MKVRNNKLAVVIFILPAALLFFGIIILPIFLSGYYSLLDWDGITNGVFVGLNNYLEIFTSKSIGFPQSVRNVLILAVLAVLIQLPISLFLAILLSNGIKGERFFLSVFFIPVLISTVVTGQLWMKIYNNDYGLLNVFLRAVGLEHLTRVWLGDVDTALWAVFVPQLWQYIGYNMLLLYAGIKSQSPEIREAARIDGAGSVKLAFYVTIPQLKPVLKVCTIFAVVGSLKIFDLIYVLTDGGPVHASEVPSTLMVRMIFFRDRYGLGSAMAVSIIVICFFFAIVIRRLFEIGEDTYESKKRRK